MKHSEFIIHLLLIFVLNNYLGLTKRLDPVLFTNNRVYALQNQHSGKYLTAGDGGIYQRTSDHGTHTKDQLWKIQAISKQGFQLMPINGEPALMKTWKPNYLGFGKYQLRNLESGKCLEAFFLDQDQDETECNRDNPLQEWFPTLKIDEV